MAAFGIVFPLLCFLLIWAPSRAHQLINQRQYQWRERHEIQLVNKRDGDGNGDDGKMGDELQQFSTHQTLVYRGESFWGEGKSLGMLSRTSLQCFLD